MLPDQLPLSLARTVVPSPPPMAQENRRAIDTHQGRTPHVMVPAAISNAQAAHSVHAIPLVHGAVQDQAGNAAVAGVAMRTIPILIPAKPVANPS